MSNLPPQPPRFDAGAPASPGGPVRPAAPVSPAAPLERQYEPKFGNLTAYLLGRFCAAFVDTLAIGFVIATFLFHATIGSGTTLSWVLVPIAARSEGAFAALAGLSIAGAMLLAFFTEALVGTTIGKLLFALNVRTLRGGWAGFGRVFVRSLLRPIDLLLIGPLLAAVTPKHQRLGDMLAGTVVGRSVIGPFAPMLAIGVLSAIGYAQVLFGGGLVSVLGVAAQAAAFGPSLLGRAFNVGRGISGQFPAAASPAPSAAPAASEGPAAAPAPSDAPAAAPSPESTTGRATTPEPAATASL
jgi:uncharacterized RDD family membrane protein YckC